MTVLTASEHEVESAITAYLDLVLPRDALHFHISNEGKRGWHQQTTFKAAGGKSGIPDRCILHCGRAYFLEAKGTHGRSSEAQMSIHDLIMAAGCDVKVVRSIDDVKSALSTWGILR